MLTVPSVPCNLCKAAMLLHSTLLMFRVLLMFPTRVTCPPPLPPHQVSVSECGLDVGAGVTLSSLEEALKQQVQQQPPHKTRGFAAAAEQLRWFAGEHVCDGSCWSCCPALGLCNWTTHAQQVELVIEGERLLMVRLHNCCPACHEKHSYSILTERWGPQPSAHGVRLKL